MSSPPPQTPAPQIIFMPAGRDWAQIFATGLPGLAAVIALVFAFLQVRESNSQLYLSQQGQVTEQLNTATANLASHDTDVRLGGIAALETIMQESKRNQPSVINILSAYVRSHAPLSSKNSQPSPDIVAAVTVIGQNGSAVDEIPDPSLGDRYFLTDLGRTDLRDANLTGDFPLATLAGADLTNAYFEGGSFRKGVFTEAKILDGQFKDADLDGANFTDADLVNANFRGANLRNANFTGANLSGADFTGADTSKAKFAQANMRGAKGKI